MRMRTLIVLACITFRAALTSAQQYAPQQYPTTAPTTGPADDERLTPVHTIDHPALFHPAFKDQGEWERRARYLRLQILTAEGLNPAPPKGPLNAVIHGRIERDGYTIEKVCFASMPGHYVSGNLYRPTGKTGRLPAVLCPHGHWANGRLYEAPDKDVRQQLASGAEIYPEAAKYPLQALCVTMVRLGCVVFQYDMVGYADDNTIEHRTGFNDVEAILRLQSFMGLQTWNSIRALDFLCELPDVDPSRIAVTGASGGGTQTLILCAIDDRPAVAAPAVMVSESMQGGCICENAPLLRVGTNNAEIAALFAPRPLAMTSANDWTVDLLTRGYPQIQAIYQLYGAKDQVMAWHRPFPHNYNHVSRELVANFFNEHLKLGLPEPVTEKPFTPTPPKELSVFDAEHPKPADILDAAGLRKQMTEQSEALLHRKGRLSVSERIWTPLLGDEISYSAVTAEVKEQSMVDASVAVKRGTLLRSDRPVRLPFLLVSPPKPRHVLVWVHPEGKRSIFAQERQLKPAAKLALDQQIAVLAIDVLGTGELAFPKGTPPLAIDYAKRTYGGFHFGYNRSLLAERASDVATAATFARDLLYSSSNDAEVCVVGFSGMGPAALVASRLRECPMSIDLAHFDFDQVKVLDDENLLPGALKYGGVAGMSADHCVSLTVFNPPPSLEKLRDHSITLKDEIATEESLVAAALPGAKKAR